MTQINLKEYFIPTTTTIKENTGLLFSPQVIYNVIYRIQNMGKYFMRIVRIITIKHTSFQNDAEIFKRHPLPIYDLQPLIVLEVSNKAHEKPEKYVQ